MARFDEAANIALANRLQEAGANVMYGVVGYKTHAKLIMVVRREAERLRRYCHLGTGNYHPQTTRLYTDYGLFTCDEAIGEDLHELFLQLTSPTRVAQLQKILQSPFTLHEAMLERTRREIAHARAGRPARIIAKMNSLVEPQIVRALYEASQAGVKVDLIVRGICALRPGVPGVSDNITVRSIVGRFLEHSRVFYFENGGEAETFCSSADWMERNFFRRIEVCFPVQRRHHRAGPRGPRALPRRQQPGLGAAARRNLRAGRRRATRRRCRHRSRCWPPSPTEPSRVSVARRRKPAASQVFGFLLEVRRGERVLGEPAAREPECLATALAP